MAIITKIRKTNAKNFVDDNKYGFIFIVPNHTRLVNEYDNKRMEALVNLFGCGTTERLVQIWTHNADGDNWSDHGDPYGREFETGLRKDLFPNVFPKAFFEGLKEGDVLGLEMEDEDGNIHFQNLVLKQQGYRYERFGKFEEVLEKI